ncbi:hypothetical protein [Gordonia sp. (in: high G+C Gram-positive bacteria)]|uniref:hypothetical protein n=1 Tax=Gordonia sp. (in: high G+C Gram-positive bacteria) TaxID=84139 RepID=UPI00168FBC5A|nr:hypothetical protein [Gordonia sp. (in: high G+C Gram-positive bacteria)]NLG45208.1 hypothetical protein [Gordonia sp. (in: high G+C Gram-positive bacteria)]
MPVRSRDRARALLADSAEGLDAHQVAEALDVHVTTARFHLNNLVDEGAAISETLRPDGVGRPRVLYRLVPAPPSDELLHLLLRQLGGTEAEREQLASLAGRAWAQSHAGPAATFDDGSVPDPVVVIETLLTRLGFRITDVVSAFGSHRVLLCSCPLQTIAARNPEIAHGVVRGAIAYALGQASQALDGAYAIDVSPDPAGACELRLALTPVRARA